MTRHYDPGLVAISVVIAMLAAYAGLLFAGHVTSASQRPRPTWLVGGAVVMGLGIWSMHFVGMLAFRLPVAIGYGVNLIAVSVAVAIAASLLALIVVSRAELRPMRLFWASALMGAAISGMHYIGMAAMSAPVRVTYTPALVALSVAIAIGASFAGLWLGFRFRSDKTSGATLRKAASAVVMGVAISGMHYTGMAAARFVPGFMISVSGSHVLATRELGDVIALGTLVIIMLGIVGSALEHHWLAERAALTEDALREARAELARAARLTIMGELAASIAHEINQPLAAIVSNGGAGLRWLSRDTPNLDEVRDSITHMMSDAKRAADVVRGLRGLAKKSGPQLTTLDIDDTIHEVLALTRSEAQRQGVVLRTVLAAGDRPVIGDRVQLQQVLLNLILNGIDAMQTTDTKELTVLSAVTEPGSVLVSVEDSGPGLDPAIAQRIFDPFFTTKADGLGMGLSICRSIIEVHGGRLWVSPRMPHGTALRFTVPVGMTT